MKKITKIISLMLTVLFVQTNVLAIQTVPVIQQKDISKSNSKSQTEASLGYDKINMLFDRYINNFKNCQQVHFEDHTDIYGLKIFYKFDINGWNGDRCEWYFTGNIGGLGKDIRELFEIPFSDEAISAIEPKIKCGFTKEQLSNILDIIKYSNTSDEVAVRNIMNKGDNDLKKSSVLLEDSSDKYKKQREELVQSLIDGKTCTILNQEELMNNFYQLMGIEQK